jgi:hypothetical protein
MLHSPRALLSNRPAVGMQPAARPGAIAFVIMTTLSPITLLLPAPLTQEETTQLADAVETVRQGMGTFLEVGRALMRIRDLRLYRNLAPTFEVFCSKVLGMSKQHCYNYIACSDVFGMLESRPEFAGRLPQNEAQTRPLRSLDQETAIDVWTEVVAQSSDGPITAALVRAVAKKRLPATESETATPEGRSPEAVARLRRSVQSLRKAMEAASGDYSERGLALVSELERLLSDTPQV